MRAIMSTSIWSNSRLNGPNVRRNNGIDKDGQRHRRLDDDGHNQCGCGRTRQAGAALPPNLREFRDQF